MRFRNAVASVIAAVILVAAIDSATAGNPPTEVKGTVILDATPLKSGRIFFYLPGGEFVGATIKDGKYRLTHVPVGEWSIGIEGSGVPKKFTLVETTQLKASVRTGTSVLDFALTK